MVAHMPRNYLECSRFSANELTNLTVRTGPWQSKGSLGPKVPLDLREEGLAGALALLNNSEPHWSGPELGQGWSQDIGGNEGEELRLGQGPQRAPQPPEGAPWFCSETQE